MKLPLLNIEGTKAETIELSEDKEKTLKTFKNVSSHNAQILSESVKHGTLSTVCISILDLIFVFDFNSDKVYTFF